MARDILDLGADVFDDTVVEAKHRISPKKRNYIIGLSITGVLLAASVTITVIAANSWLLDYSNLNKIQFYFTPTNMLEEGEEQTLTLYKLDPEVKYPEVFRIPERVQGYKVAHVAEGAFSGHEEIKRVIFTQYVESVGKNAFSNCTNLEDFTWNNRLHSIGEDAFIGTKYLSKLQSNPSGKEVIPSGTLIYLGSQYFEDNTALVSNALSTEEKTNIKTKYGITDNDFYSFADLGVTNIVDGVFANNQKISYIDFPDFLNKTGNKTFYSCHNLKGINFTHSNITSVGVSAFEGCQNLKDITFSDILTELGNKAFAKTAIEEIPALHKVNSIGNGVFQGCENLETVIYPASEKLTYVPEDMFKDCTSLKTIHWADNTNSGIDYITDIKIGAFANTAFEEFTLPKNVNSILDKTFEGCEKLTTFKLYGNPSLKADVSYDENAYTGEWSYGSSFQGELYGYDGTLTNSVEADGIHVTLSKIEGTYPNTNILFVIPLDKVATLQSYNENPVDDPELLESILSIQDASKYYELNFYNDLSLEVNITGSVFYEDDGTAHPGELLGVKDIRSKAFNNASKLKTIALYGDDGADIAGKSDEGVFNFPLSLYFTNNDSYNNNTNYTFAGSDARTINIPANQVHIGSYAFANLTNLENVNFSANSHLTHIWSSAFQGDTKLTSISLPDSLTDIKPSVFSGCTSLETINFNNAKVGTINANTFLNCSSLASIKLPNTITGIKNNAFDGTTSLNHVVIPSTIKELNLDAFTNCREAVYEANPTTGIQEFKSLADGQKRMPIYVQLTTAEMAKVNYKAGWFNDKFAFDSYLLGNGEAKVAGVSYWQGTVDAPVEIKVTSVDQNGELTKTSYNAGEAFNSSGLTFQANYDDSTSINDVSSAIVWNKLTSGDTSATGTYTVGSVTIDIVVNGITVA